MPAGGNPRPTLVGSLRTQLETGTAEELMTTVDYNAFTRQLMAEIRENGRPTSGPMAGRPLMILTTKGAKSGEPRSAVVTYTRDGDRYVIAASKGGAPTHPAWYFNMARNPDKVWTEIRGRVQKVRPASLSGEERAAAWRRVIAAAPGCAGYESKTDREIPIVRLTPESPSST